jgi:hypothetical protein
MISTDSVRVYLGMARPDSSWISTLIDPAAEVE